MTFDRNSFVLGTVAASAIGVAGYYYEKYPDFDTTSFILGIIAVSGIGAIGYYYKKSQQSQRQLPTQSIINS